MWVVRFQRAWRVAWIRDPVLAERVLWAAVVVVGDDLRLREDASMIYAVAEDEGKCGAGAGD